MSMNVTGSIRFSNEGSVCYYPLSGANNNRDSFPNCTVTNAGNYPSYDDTHVSTSGATSTRDTTLISDTARESIILNNDHLNIKFSGDYIFDSGTSEAIYSPSTITGNDDITTYLVNSNSTGIGITIPHTATTGSSSNGQLRIYSGNTEELYFNSGGYVSVSKEDQKLIKRQKLKRNLVINIKSRADLMRDIPKNEQIAIETLREEITETEFRKYIKYGFVLIEGQSGKTYQVFRNRSHTKVWKGGEFIEEICVRIKDSEIPPTDNVIAFLNMIQIDENEFRKIGNIYKMHRAAA